MLRVYCIIRLGTAQWTASSVAMQPECYPLHGQQTTDKQTFCIIAHFVSTNTEFTHNSRLQFYHGGKKV